MNSRHKTHRRESARGAVVVEAALVLPLILALLAGFLDFAWILNDLQTTRQETREVVRDAVVGNAGADTSCSHSAGHVNTVTTGLICDVKARLGDDAVISLVLPDTGGYVQDNAIRICVQQPYISLTGIYATIVEDGVASVRVESRIESEGTEAFEEFAEPAASGHTWAFCT